MMKQFRCFLLTTSFTTKKGRNRDPKTIYTTTVEFYCAVLLFIPLPFFLRSTRTGCFASFFSDP
ncbi:hypothetical protein NC652_006860 [Populus alba x Populus x berolinensis]|nr:hypothetical protein NC652_006860 [Populus alba x Populus x berolinensis]